MLSLFSRGVENNKGIMMVIVSINIKATTLTLVAAVVALLLHVHISDATYSCCSEERRGTVCTLAGNGDPNSIDSPNASTAAIYSPGGVVMYPPYGIIVGGYNEYRLRIIHDNGTVSTLAGGGPIGESAGSFVDSDDPLVARFWAPAGVCTDDDANLLLCDCYNHRIRTVLRNGSVRTLAGTGETGYAKGGYADCADPLQSRFFHPYGIASIVDNGQRLIIIGGNWDHRIRVIYANMTVSTLAGTGIIGFMTGEFKDCADPLAARFCHPIGVAQDHFGNIIVAETFSGRIRKVWRDGSQSGVTTIAGKGPIGDSGGSSIDSDNPLDASFFSPIGIAIDGAGSILVSCRSEHRIRMILVNGSVRTLAGSGPTSDLSVATLGGFLDNVPVPRAIFNGPHFITIDHKGNVIVSDSNNQRVRMLCLNMPITPTSSASLLSNSTVDRHSETHSLEHSPSPIYTAFPATATKPLSATRSSTTSPTATQSPLPTRTSSRTLHELKHSTQNPISRLVSSEEAASAIVASGAAAAALAGFAATTSMGHATRMGALMRSVNCAFASGELDPPSLVELPLQWSMESQGGSVGSHAGSALLTSAVLVVLPLLMCAVVHAILSSCGVSERPTLRSLQRSVLSRYCLLSMAFFAPNVLMSSVVVVGRGASSGAVVAAICAAIVPLLLGCVAGQRALAMDVEVVPLCGGKWELRNRPSSRAYVETFGGLVNGCRNPTPYIVRVCFLEDAAASLVLSLLSGVSLSTARCEWVALAMLVVCALHLLYVACVRPLRSALESAMNCCLCGVQVLMAALCLAIASGADNWGGVLMSVLGVVAVVQNASFFVQAAILAACACVSESRKKHTALSGAGPAGGTSMMNMPISDHALLSAPEAKQLPLISAS